MRPFISTWLLFGAAIGVAAPRQSIGRARAGEALPFESAEATLDFLRTARVVEERDIGSGVNRSKKVLLDTDGVRAHAIFREVDIRVENRRIGDRAYRRFADSYLFECAAYELSRLLGIDAIPPVVRRRIGQREGSLQIWIEDTLDETARDFRPTNATEWVGQLWEMYVFDNLVFNVDRNQGNLLVDRSYRLWMIDHTRAFQTVSELLDDHVVRVRRRTYARIQVLTEESLGQALGDYLDASEILFLLERRDLLVARIEALVSERGEDVVFY